MSNSSRWRDLMQWIRSIEDDEEYWDIKYDKFYQILKDKIREIKAKNERGGVK